MSWLSMKIANRKPNLYDAYAQVKGGHAERET
jgi:hypothetical protein